MRVVLPPPVSCCSAPFLLILAPLLSVCCCGVLWVGKCGGVCRGWHGAGDACLAVWCVWWRSGACPTPSRIVQPPFSLCVCCHSIVGLVWCLCDRVVSLWNSGDGLCGVEGRVVSTVRCQLFMCCVVLCCAVGCGMAGGSRCSSFSSLCLPLLLFVVGVRGSARAALRARTLSPNTIALPLLRSLLSALPPSSCPAFLLLEWRCVIHHVSECCVGMTATGSLSLSFLFFW